MQETSLQRMLRRQLNHENVLPKKGEGVQTFLASEYAHVVNRKKSHGLRSCELDGWFTVRPFETVFESILAGVHERERERERGV